MVEAGRQEISPRGVRIQSGREDLFGVAKRLEFQRVPAGISEEHGGLFAWQPLETEIGFDDERHVSFPESIGEENRNRIRQQWRAESSCITEAP